jgi:peptide deformylase
MIYDVIRYPDRRLETPCAPVTEFDTPELHQLVEDMFETMYYHKGVGLAAPQIGVLQQIAVIDISQTEEDAEPEKIVIINPEITSKNGKVKSEEGCLCFPGFREKVVRAKIAVVKAKDAAGKEFVIESEDLKARALQHEIDHLNGVLFIKYLSALKRDLIRRKIRKMTKAGDWPTVVSGPSSRESTAVEA